MIVNCGGEIVIAISMREQREDNEDKDEDTITTYKNTDTRDMDRHMNRL